MAQHPHKDPSKLLALEAQDWAHGQVQSLGVGSDRRRLVRCDWHRSKEDDLLRSLSRCFDMYVCLYVCMYVCMCVCMSACLHVCMYACMHVFMYACIHVCMYSCLHGQN